MVLPPVVHKTVNATRTTLRPFGSAADRLEQILPCPGLMKTERCSYVYLRLHEYPFDIHVFSTLLSNWTNKRDKCEASEPFGYIGLNTA